MVTTDTLEGFINEVLSYHYDVESDVLYLRVSAHRDTPTLGEETDDGLIELRDEENGQLVGLTVVHWWKRFGTGPLPDSLREIERQLEPWAARLAA